MEEKSLIGLDDKYIKILNYCSFFSQNDNDFNRVNELIGFVSDDNSLYHRSNEYIIYSKHNIFCLTFIITLI